MTPDETSTEPLLSVGGITAAATAAVGLVAAFGLPISDEMRAAILGLVAVAAPLVVAFIARRKVYAPATVAKLLRR